jgi:hypothetical protein
MNKATAHPEALSVEMPVSELPEGLARHARHMLGDGAHVQVTVTDARDREEKLAALRQYVAEGLESLDKGEAIPAETVFARLHKKIHSKITIKKSLCL